MKITRNNNVLIETTNRIHGCLEQGGVCGRVVTYPLKKVMAITGSSRDEIAEAEQYDYPDGHETTYHDLLEHALSGRVIRKGQPID